MTQIIKTHSIAKELANTNWVLLEKTSETALVFKPQVHPGGVRGWLVRYKRNKDEEWKPLKREDFRSMKINEGIYIELNTVSMERLFKAIGERRKLVNQDIGSGDNEYVVGKKEEVLVISNQNIKEAVEQILLKGITEDFWKELKSINPKEASRLSLIQLQSERISSLQEFRINMEDDDKQEDYWQDFFEKNKWIFGYGLNYKILRQEQSQPNYGGTRLDGSGGQRGDTLASSLGDFGFTVLVEIKTPFTPLLQGTTEQRNGAWSLSKELTDGLTQLQANQSTWELRGSREVENRDVLESRGIYTIKPGGILIISRLNQLESHSKRGTLHRFRQSIQGIEIITFDELLKRAEFIVEGML